MKYYDVTTGILKAAELCERAGGRLRAVARDWDPYHFLHIDASGDQLSLLGEVLGFARLSDKDYRDTLRGVLQGRGS